MRGDVSADGTAGRVAVRGARFALTKFRPTTLPNTLITRSVLHDRLTAEAGKRLTIVVGSAGTGKSVLLSSWAATRPSGVTSWMSCDEADADPLRFWTAFIEAPRELAPGFGADAAELLSMDNVMSADVTASIANDVATLPTGSAIIVDDFHTVGSAVSKDMTDLVERWPADTAQLVLASRFDPPLRLHRWRMSGELGELRDHDLYFSLSEIRDLLANFDVQVAPADLALLQQRSEGWAAAVQMAALSLRGTNDPLRVARALDVRGHALADYFISEVLERQPAEVARFMLDTSVLRELTASVCAAITQRRDAAALLRSIDSANLFMVALDDDRTSYRYHHLVRHVLHAELCARDRPREQTLQLRAGEWYESTGEARQAAHHLLAARQAERALALMQDQVVGDFLRDPVLRAAPDLSTLDPTLLANAPERLLALAADLLLSGDLARAAQYLDLLERTQPPIIPRESTLAARFATLRCVRHALIGQADKAVAEALTARAMQDRTQVTDEWTAALPVILMRAYLWLEDFPAIEHEAAVALAAPALPEPVKLVQVRGAQAQAWFEFGRLAQAADAARAADTDAQRLGFDQHFFAVDHLRVLAGAALERRDLDTAELLAERALSISEHGRPAFAFLGILDRAEIWATRGQIREALATIDAARRVLKGTRSVLLARSDELEAVLRLALGDLRYPADLASTLPAARRGLLLAKIALAANDPHAAQEHLRASPLADVTPRHALVRQLLLAAAAIERGDPTASAVLASALQTARHDGFLNTVVTTATQVTTYLVEHSTQARSDPFMEQLIAAALDVRATQPDARRRGPIEPLTAAELRVLRLLPTSTYLQIAASLYISHNTVKAHLRSIYQKLGATSRSQAIERAVDLRLL
jgi:LuxR family transcriptional regulator, maltose regulon positive regulatory protein